MTTTAYYDKHTGQAWPVLDAATALALATDGDAAAFLGRALGPSALASITATHRPDEIEQAADVLYDFLTPDLIEPDPFE